MSVQFAWATESWRQFTTIYHDDDDDACMPRFALTSPQGETLLRLGKTLVVVALARVPVAVLVPVVPLALGLGVVEGDNEALWAQTNVKRPRRKQGIDSLILGEDVTL